MAHMTIVTYVLAFLVGTLTTARIARMVYHDSFPPMEWLRDVWDRKTATSKWNDLLHCPFCLTPYIGAVITAWALLSHFHWSWWVFCVWTAGAYLAATIPASKWG